MAQNYLPSYFIEDDGTLFSPMPRSKPQPVQAWEAGEDGKRRQTGPQEHDAQGRPVWEQEVALYREVFGKPQSETVKVRWAGEPVMPGTAEGFPAPAVKEGAR